MHFWFSFFRMQSILQSIVKVIIIGTMAQEITVSGNSPFSSLQPLPYYENEDYYIPNFLPPYHNSLSVFYPQERKPSPISYQNINYYNPLSLFDQNENFHFSPLSNPVEEYKITGISSHKQNYKTPYVLPPKVQFHHAQINYKPLYPTQHNSNYLPSVTAYQQAKIIIKEENDQPFYQDKYNKNYPEEEYNDNYNDDVDSQTNPCANFPYQFFQPGDYKKYYPCHQNFVSKVYGLKAPITILPSRFPPRIEQLIERIQNYFSTYTQQGVTKPPINQTQPTNISITNSAENSENNITSGFQTTNLHFNNKTSEYKIQNASKLEESPHQNEHLSPTTFSVNEINGLGLVTEQPLSNLNFSELNKIVSSINDPNGEIKNSTQLYENKSHQNDFTQNFSEVEANLKYVLPENETHNFERNTDFKLSKTDIPKEYSVIKNLNKQETENMPDNGVSTTTTNNKVDSELETQTTKIEILYNSNNSTENFYNVNKHNNSTINEVTHYITNNNG